MARRRNRTQLAHDSDIYRFNLGSSALAASTTNTLAVGGTLQFVETMGYGFASGTAMHYSEDVALTTSGNRTITLRKYNNTLASNMWNATIWNAKTDASSYNTRPFYQGNYAYVSSIGIHYSWDSYNADSAGTSLVYVVNDVSGSVYTAPFFVSSATSRGGVNFALYVPPVAAGNGTIYAWGTSVTATGSTTDRGLFGTNVTGTDVANVAGTVAPIAALAGNSDLVKTAIALNLIGSAADIRTEQDVINLGSKIAMLAAGPAGNVVAAGLGLATGNTPMTVNALLGAVNPTLGLVNTISGNLTGYNLGDVVNGLLNAPEGAISEYGLIGAANIGNSLVASRKGSSYKSRHRSLHTCKIRGR